MTSRGARFVEVHYGFDLKDALVVVYVEFRGIEDASLPVELARILTEKYGAPVEDELDLKTEDSTGFDEAYRELHIEKYGVPPVEEEQGDSPEGYLYRKWTTPRTEIKLQSSLSTYQSLPFYDELRVWYSKPPRDLEELKHLF